MDTKPQVNYLPNLRARRLGLGWSRPQLAVASGVSERTIAHGEAGRSLSALTVARLDRALDRGAALDRQPAPNESERQAGRLALAKYDGVPPPHAAA